ncbi:MAG TPA: NFACT RNA binding domain-containing protein [Clostridia bacterium]|nr:NFACT RNA binding domain-containing protein [Clostridia bacterium]
MPLDGIAVKCLANELNSICLNAKIQNIYMTKKDEVILGIYANGTSCNIALSLEPSSPGIYVMKEKVINPKTPYSFCMFLRKHIGNGYINKVYTKDYERIIYFDINHTDELDDNTDKTLIMELTGRNCNLIVINSSNRIMDALRHVDESMSSVRRIMPVSEYKLPPLQDKIPIENLEWGHLLKYADFPVSEALFRTVIGIAQVFAKEICVRAGIEESKTVRSLEDKEASRIMLSLKKIAFDISENSYMPIALYDKDKKAIKDYYCFDLMLYKNMTGFSVNRYTSFIEVFTEYLSLKSKRADLMQKSDTIKKLVSAHLTKAEKKLAIYNNSLSDLYKINQYKLFGELLTANIPMLKQRTAFVELLDYYTNDNVRIPLDPSKDALKNAQAYYKKYKKGMAAYNYASNAIKDISKEAEYLKSVLSSLDLCETIQDIEDIKRELILQGYIKEKQQIKKNRKKTEPEAVSYNPIRYQSEEGYEIYVGRNNTENDKLTFWFAETYDIWLHVKSMHGSHVIIKNPAKCEKYVPDKTLTQAAIIAASHSEAKKSGQVAVDYTFIKNVKKPKGAKPGYVNYFNYYSAYVKADTQMQEKLRKR